MDEVTQQNSALVEENAATAKTLEGQSAAMNERISFFRTSQEVPGVTQAARGTVPPRRKFVKQRGPVGRMQAGLAVALTQAPEFAEF